MKHKAELTSYSRYRADLKTGRLRGFGAYLLPSLTNISLNSLSSGLGSANIATSLGALGGIALVGTAGVTIAGAAAVSAVCGVVALAAVVVGVSSLKKEYETNKAATEAVVGDGIKQGKVKDLKTVIASVAYQLTAYDVIESDAIDKMLFSLSSVKGNSLTEKLCDIYGIDAEALSVKLNPEEKESVIESLLCAKLCAALPAGENVSPETINQGLQRLKDGHERSLATFKEQIATVVDQQQPHDPIEKAIFRQNLQALMKKISQLQGENFHEKLACLHSSNLESASEQGKNFQEYLENEKIDGTNKREALYKIIEKEVETQYFELLVAHKKSSVGLNDLDLSHDIDEFKKSLALIHGIDNKNKMNRLFTEKNWKSYSLRFKEKAKEHLTKVTVMETPAETDDATAGMIAIEEVKSAVLTDAELKEAKDYIEKQLFAGSFMTPADYAKKYFTAFSGGVTGFGLVVGIAALVGVSVGTGGVGLGVLIAALALTAIGFSAAVWYSNHTKKRDLRIKKEIQSADNIITKTCEHANNFIKEAEAVLHNQPMEKTDSLLLKAPEFTPLNEEEQELVRLNRQIHELQAEIIQLKTQPQPAEGTSQPPQPGPAPSNEKGKEKADEPVFKRSEKPTFSVKSDNKMRQFRKSLAEPPSETDLDNQSTDDNDETSFKIQQPKSL